MDEIFKASFHLHPHASLSIPKPPTQKFSNAGDNLLKLVAAVLLFFRFQSFHSSISQHPSQITSLFLFHTSLFYLHFISLLSFYFYHPKTCLSFSLVFSRPLFPPPPHLPFLPPFPIFPSLSRSSCLPISQKCKFVFPICRGLGGRGKVKYLI